MASVILSAKDAKALYSEGHLKAEFVTGSRSEVWNNFAFLNDASSGDYCGFVVCNRCGDTFKHRKRYSGTSRLGKHMKERCRMSKYVPPGQGLISSFLPKPNAESRLLKAAASYIVKDVRPFRSLEGDGFREFARTLLEMGAKYGPLNAADIVPSKDTVKQEVLRNAAVEKTKNATNLKDALKEYGTFGLTTDTWVDVKNRHCVSLAAHYICEEKLLSVAICVKQFEENDTGVDVMNKIQESCKEMGLSSSLLDRCYFVTNDATNVRLALTSRKTLNCACQMLSTVLNYTMSVDRHCPVNESDAEMINKISDTISHCESLAAYFKRAGLNNELSSALKQSGKTQIDSVVYMLRSIHENRKDVEQILKNANEMERLDGIDWALVTVLIEFLEPFEQATKNLELGSHPTLHLVYLYFTKIERSLAANSSDDPILECMKRRGLFYLRKEFVLADLHRLGLFLYPKFKALVPLSEPERMRVHQLARDLLTALVHKGASSLDKENVPMKQEFENVEEEMLHWMAHDAARDEDEISRYIKFQFSVTTLNSYYDQHAAMFDIAKFWSSPTVKLQFPLLSRSALGVLSIPASSTGSMRGNNVTKNRAALSAATLESILILNSSLK